MTYTVSMEFPAQPTAKDIKELKRQVAKDKFRPIDGGKAPKKKTDSKT